MSDCCIGYYSTLSVNPQVIQGEYFRIPVDPIYVRDIRESIIPIEDDTIFKKNQEYFHSPDLLTADENYASQAIIKKPSTRIEVDMEMPGADLEAEIKDQVEDPDISGQVEAPEVSGQVVDTAGYRNPAGPEGSGKGSPKKMWIYYGNGLRPAGGGVLQNLSKVIVDNPATDHLKRDIRKGKKMVNKYLEKKKIGAKKKRILRPVEQAVMKMNKNPKFKVGQKLKKRLAKSSKSMEKRTQIKDLLARLR